MEPLTRQFDAALQHVRTTTKVKLGNKEKLKLYALFKQAELGDCTDEMPKRNKVVALAKWKAWTEQKGKSSEECMREYVEYLSSIDSSFTIESSKISKLGSLHEMGLDNLPESQDMSRLSRRVWGKERPTSYASKFSGRNPLTGKEDEEERVQLYERIRRFYERHNMAKLNSGIGDIVDWVIENGEDALNQNLRNKYNEDLNTVDEAIAKEEARRQKKLEEAEKIVESAEDSSNVKDQLTQFFLLYDPNRAAAGFDVLLKYHERRGIDALNSKLFEKYGANLDNVQLPGSTQTSKNTDSKESKGSKETELKNVQMHELLSYKVDEELMDLLINFYAKYDPERLENGSLDLIYRWTERNGVDKLNERLKKQYNESLDEFADVALRLQNEVIAFYDRVDKTKLVQGVDHVINWGLKNGRAALNKRLRQKYGTDLEDGVLLRDLDF